MNQWVVRHFRHFVHMWISWIPQTSTTDRSINLVSVADIHGVFWPNANFSVPRNYCFPVVWVAFTILSIIAKQNDLAWFICFWLPARSTACQRKELLDRKPLPDQRILWSKNRTQSSCMLTAQMAETQIAERSSRSYLDQHAKLMPPNTQ